MYTRLRMSNVPYKQMAHAVQAIMTLIMPCSVHQRSSLHSHAHLQNFPMLSGARQHKFINIFDNNAIIVYFAPTTLCFTWYLPSTSWNVLGPLPKVNYCPRARIKLAKAHLSGLDTGVLINLQMRIFCFLSRLYVCS